MFFLRLQKAVRKIDNSGATQVNVERHFFNRFTVWIKMETRIGMRAVVHAHRDGAEIHGLAFGDLCRQSVMKRLVAGPFCQILGKRS